MEPTIEQDDRPREISRAAQFLASSLAIGLITSIFHLAQRISGVAMVFALLVVIAVFGIGFLVIWRISAIRWMKIVTSGLLILSAALAVLALIALFSANYVAALACAVASVLAYLVHKRRNWARIVWLVLILFGLPFAIPANLQEIRRNVLSGTLSVIVTLLQLIGTWLLFTRNSNRWFRTRK